MKNSAILAAACVSAVIAAPAVDPRDNGQNQLLGGFNIGGAPGQEAFAGFAGFLDNFFNGLIFSPISKAIQGDPVGAVGDAVQGAVGTVQNLGKTAGNVANGAANGYQPTSKSESQKAQGAANAGVNLGQYESEQAAASANDPNNNPVMNLISGGGSTKGLTTQGQGAQGKGDQNKQSQAQTQTSQAAQASQASQASQAAQG
ncbi:hypothetical protein PWT90_05312 [Aphanocladium album]|nr:hypothetical protein PWT90_05312 [Aphanocladium album]